MNLHSLLFITTYTDLGDGESAKLVLVEQLDPPRYRPICSRSPMGNPRRNNGARAAFLCTAERG